MAISNAAPIHVLGCDSFQAVSLYMFYTSTACGACDKYQFCCSLLGSEGSYKLPLLQILSFSDKSCESKSLKF